MNGIRPKVCAGSLLSIQLGRAGRVPATRLNAFRTLHFPMQGLGVQDNQARRCHDHLGTSWRNCHQCTRLVGGTSADGFLQRIKEPCSSKLPRVPAQLSPLTFHSTHVARVVRSSILFPMGLRVCLWPRENFFGATRMRPRMSQLLFCIQAPWPQLLFFCCSTSTLGEDGLIGSQNKLDSALNLDAVSG